MLQSLSTWLTLSVNCPTKKQASAMAQHEPDVAQTSDHCACVIVTVRKPSSVGAGRPHLPRSLTRALGPQSNAVNANAVMWAFFVAHPRAV